MTEEEIKNTAMIEASVISARMIRCMGEFLDLNNINKWNNIDHLEALRQELNTLMGRFLEVNKLVNREYVDTSGEIGTSEMEMFKTEIEKVTEMEKRKANKEGEE